MESRTRENDLGIVHTWGDGPEVVFLSNPLADPVAWTAQVRDELVSSGYRVTTFEHRPSEFDWQSVVACVTKFVKLRAEPVSLVGWSQGAVIGQEVTLAAGEQVCSAVLLAPYGRQNEIDKMLQQAWDSLAEQGADSVRAVLGLLTAFPAGMLSEDAFVRSFMKSQPGWGNRPDADLRRRSSEFIASYQNRLEALRGVKRPCLVMGFELDSDTFALRAREVANAIPRAEYLELAGLSHAAPFTDPGSVWPPVVSFLREHHLVV